MTTGNSKKATRYGDTKLLLACGSFLAFAGLTAFIAGRNPPPDPATAGPLPLGAAQRAIVPDGDEGPALAPAPVRAPRPIARTRGT